MINAPASGGYDPGRGYSPSQAPQNAAHSGGYGMQGSHGMNPGNLSNIQQVNNGYNMPQHMANRGMISNSSGPVPQLVSRFVNSPGVGMPLNHQSQLQAPPLSQASLHPQQSLPSQYSALGMTPQQLIRASLSGGGLSSLAPGGAPATSSVSTLGSTQAQPVSQSGLQSRNPRSASENQLHGQARSMMTQNGPSVHRFNGGRPPVSSHVGIPSGSMPMNVSQGMRMQQMQSSGISNGMDTSTVSSQGSGLQSMNSSGGYGNSNGDLLAFLNNASLTSHPKKAGAVANSGSAVNGISEAYSMSNNANMYSHRSEQSQLPFGTEDFPSLSGGNRSGLSSGPNQAPDMASVARGLASNQEFSIQSEDFPELPGYKGSGWGSSRLDQSLEASAFFQGENSSNIAILGGRRTPSTGKSSQHGLTHVPRHRSGTNSSTGDGQAAPLTGLNSMRGQASGVSKQEGHHEFGLMGLMSVIKMSDPDLSMLALGTDLTTLGLNLNASEPLCQRFVSPWAVEPVSSNPEFDKIDADSINATDFNSAVPARHFQPSGKLSSTAIHKLSVDTLFYVFYTMPGDHAQLLSAQELSSRGWMYHKESKSWFSRLQGVEPTMKKNLMEKGSYIFFDVNSWERVRKTDFLLQYSDVENIPSVESNREDS